MLGLFNVPPIIAICNLFNATRRNFINLCNFSLRNSLANQFSYHRNIRFFQDCHARFRTKGMQAKFYHMVTILLISAPLKIFRTIVCLVSIFMIYLRIIIRIRNKSKSNQSMQTMKCLGKSNFNVSFFADTPQGEHPIRQFMRGIFTMQKPPINRFQPSNSPQGANFIHFIKTRYFLPIFHTFYVYHTCQRCNTFNRS